ncbi:MAG: hypothetical protein EOP12_02360 [Pseudomonas sp.]|nr:MAG: hypothetical protein EOP12_02360 [Pseudomonas sp.]
MTSAVIAVPCDEKKVKNPSGEERCRINGSGILRLALASHHRLAKRVVVTFANGVRLSKSPMRALVSKVPRVCDAAQATRPLDSGAAVECFVTATADPSAVR